MSQNPTKHTKVLIIDPVQPIHSSCICGKSNNPILVYGSAPGGQLTTTTDVENYPNADAIQGPWLMDQMRIKPKQLN